MNRRINYIFVGLLIFLASLGLFSQNPYEYHREGAIEIESPYPLRKIDFGVSLPADWGIDLKNPQTHGILSGKDEYALLFQSHYKGELDLDIIDFSEKLLEEVRRRLNLQIDYVRDRVYRNGAYDGIEYEGEAYFRGERMRIRILCLADKDRIILLAFLSAADNFDSNKRMDRIYRSIRLY